MEAPAQAPDLTLVSDEGLQRVAEELGPTSAEAQVLAQLTTQRAHDLQVRTHLDRTSHPGELSRVDFVRSSYRNLASRSISMRRRFKADASGNLRMRPHSLITSAPRRATARHFSIIVLTVRPLGLSTTGQ